MRCFWCEKKLTQKTATYDHLVPTCYGGQNLKENKIISCDFCNQKKGNRLIFMEKDVFELAKQEKPAYVATAQEILKNLKKMQSFERFFAKLSYGNQLYIENTILRILKNYDCNHSINKNEQ